LIGRVAATGVLPIGESWESATVLREAGDGTGWTTAAAASCPSVNAGVDVGRTSADRAAMVGRIMAGAEGERAIGARTAPLVATEASTAAGDVPGLAGSASGVGRDRAVVIAKAGPDVVVTNDGGVVRGVSWIWCALSGVGAEVATATGATFSGEADDAGAVPASKVFGAVIVGASASFDGRGANSAGAGFVLGDARAVSRAGSGGLTATGGTATVEAATCSSLICACFAFLVARDDGSSTGVEASCPTAGAAMGAELATDADTASEDSLRARTGRLVTRMAPRVPAICVPGT
jgi:hypothetical protein